jgi:hypothetical protein
MWDGIGFTRTSGGSALSEDRCPRHLCVAEIDRNYEPELAKKLSYETVHVGLSYRKPEEQLERLQKGAMPIQLLTSLKF